MLESLRTRWTSLIDSRIELVVNLQKEVMYERNILEYMSTDFDPCFYTQINLLYRRGIRLLVIVRKNIFFFIQRFQRDK